MGHKIGYARLSTVDQDPQLQLDAPAAEGCLKIHKDVAAGTKADCPQWQARLDDLRPGDTLIIWRIDRLGRSLRDPVDIVADLEDRGVGVRSLTNGIVDTTTAHGKLMLGMFALMAEYEAALIRERAVAGLTARRRNTTDQAFNAKRPSDSRILRVMRASDLSPGWVVSLLARLVRWSIIAMCFVRSREDGRTRRSPKSFTSA